MVGDIEMIYQLLARNNQGITIDDNGQSENVPMKDVVVFVGCGAKQQQANVAKDLYISSYFKKKLNHAETYYKNCQGIYILSSDPSSPVLALNQQVSGMYDYPMKLVSQAKAWSPNADATIANMFNTQSTVFVVFAGEKFYKYLNPNLKIVAPLKGLLIGQQMKYLQ